MLKDFAAGIPTLLALASDENCIFSFFKERAANALKGEAGTTISTLNTSFCVEDYNMIGNAKG